jgi:ABC-type proline/glycine betaine transport system permease subunit
MDKMEELVADTDKRLSIHEAVCAQRYENIQKRFDDGSKRMQRIEYMLYLIMAISLFGTENVSSLFKHLIVH